MRATQIRVLLVDDHDVVRAGVRTLVEAQGWQVSAEASSGKEAVKLANDVPTDVAVLDLEMADSDGVTVVRQLRQHQPNIEVVIFTMHDNEYLIREVLSAGARAFVLKSEGGRKLIQAIQSAADHMPFFAARASEALLKSLVTSRSDDLIESALTYREREIVQLVAAGSSNKEVASTLGISVKTVETHRAKVMRKLGISSIVDLVRFAVRENFIKA